MKFKGHEPKLRPSFSQLTGCIIRHLVHQKKKNQFNDMSWAHILEISANEMNVHGQMQDFG
jgi:hypothetical protein